MSNFSRKPLVGHSRTGSIQRPSSKPLTQLPDCLERPAPPSTTLAKNRRSLLPHFARKTSSDDRDQQEVDFETHVKGSAELEDNPSSFDASSCVFGDESAKNAKTVPAVSQDRTASQALDSTVQASQVGNNRIHLHTASNASNNSRITALGRSGSVRAGAGVGSTVGSVARDTNPTVKRNSSITRPSGRSQPTELSRVTSTTTVRGSTTSANVHPQITPSAAGKQSLRSAKSHSSGVSKATEASSSKPSTSPSKSKDVKLRSQMLPPPRSNLSALQQHHAPAKSSLPKPHALANRSSRDQPESASEIPTSPELAQLQMELFQLSLLHEASTEALLEFESSAYFALGKRHADLLLQYEKIKDVEALQQKIRNLRALHAWSGDPTLLADNLTTLSQVYEEISALDEPDSKFNEVVLEFSEWIGHSDGVAMLPHLSQDWRASHASVALKLRSLQHLLHTLPPVPDTAKDSSLWCLFSDCTRLINGMVQELNIVLRLENSVLQSQEGRLDQQIAQLMLADAALTQPVHWLPAWEVGKT